MKKVSFLAMMVVWCISSVAQIEEPGKKDHPLPESEKSDEVPGLIVFQERLADSDENPLNGSFNLTFRVNSTSTAGPAIWSGIRTVQIVNGLFRVKPGKIYPITPLVFSEPNRWPGIQISGSTEMTSRTTNPNARLHVSANLSNALNINNRLYVNAQPGYVGVGSDQRINSSDLHFIVHGGNNSEVKQQPAGNERTSFTLDLTLILEGPYTPGKEALMHTALHDNNLLPLSQPFKPSLPYYGNVIPVWYYPGNETVADIPVGVVDWVLVEVRDASQGDFAYTNSARARKPGFLLNTGKVAGLDGEPLSFDVDIEFGLFVVVYHRNHLSAMTPQPLENVNGSYSWDFSNGSDKAWKQGHKQLGNGVYGLYGGDADANGQIQTQDKNNVWNPQSGQSGYLAGDFDLNSQVQTQDKNNIWNPNSGLASQVPGLSQGEHCPGMPTFTDPRDGRVYNTVYINEQCWLKEDLRFLPEVSPGAEGSYQVPHFYVHGYNGSDVNEAIANANYQNYGVLYNWPAAFNACPNGWHLASDSEWTELTSFLIHNYNDITTQNVGNKLKSCRQVGSPLGDDCDTEEHPRWNFWSSVFGTDEFGFAALPSGSRSGTRSFMYLGSNVYFWNSTQTSETAAYRRHITVGGGGIGRGGTGKNAGFSVRCLRDTQFGLPEHTLQLIPQIPEAGGIYGAGSYPEGREVLLSAMAGIGYYFTGWYLDNELLSNNDSYIFTMPGHDVNIVAGFGQGTYQPCPGMETFTDPRDGKVYNTVLAGDQCWLKENLNYAAENSWCFQNNETNCTNYGRLYNWQTAIDVCPAGWHLPSHDEVTELEQFVCSTLGYAGCETSFPYNATTTGWRGTNEGNALKSCRQMNSPLGDGCLTSEHPRWNTHATEYGTDLFGYSALPGGHRHPNGFWLNFGTWFQIWTSTPHSDTHAWVRFIPHQRADISREYMGKDNAFSVRCLRNE